MKTDKEHVTDYERAKVLGLTSLDRWGTGHQHHEKTVRLMKFIQEHDSKDYGNYFDWRIGGDGDNGETLMYQMDAFFELMSHDDKVKDELSSSGPKYYGDTVIFKDSNPGRMYNY